MDRDGTDFARYGVYFTAKGALAEFGAAWLGWDVAAGCARPHPPVDGLPVPVAELTETPRRYGFHATLKPPFRLRDPETAEALGDALSEVAAGVEPVELAGLRVATLGSFVALVPEGDVTRLNALAGRLVTGIDRFRAPPSAAELDRRRARGLTPRQEEMLTRWGYPYVLDEFRFHMTLTGRLSAADAEQVQEALAPKIEPLVPSPVRIDDVTLVGEDAAGRFHEIARVPLGG
ncbi:MAG: DUF1045 domain-containing protein [Pseudomonadota bacterium]